MNKRFAVALAALLSLAASHAAPPPAAEKEAAAPVLVPASEPRMASGPIATTSDVVTKPSMKAA